MWFKHWDIWGDGEATYLKGQDDHQDLSRCKLGESTLDITAPVQDHPQMGCGRRRRGEYGGRCAALAGDTKKRSKPQPTGIARCKTCWCLGQRNMTNYLEGNKLSDCGYFITQLMWH